MASSSVALSARSAASPRVLAITRLPLAALLTIGLATLLNSGLFYVFSALGLITSIVDIPTFAGPQPLNAVMVASMTVLEMLLGTAVLALIIRFRPSNAQRTWQFVAGLVLVLSFVMPFTGIPGVPLVYGLALDAMHVVAGILAIWMLPALAARSTG
jgi:Family of unknown function (DUF6069)